MSKLVVSEFTTLDGAIEAPETWAMDYPDEKVMALKPAESMASDALPPERTSHDVFAGGPVLATYAVRQGGHR
jgi:hypothetical protein